MTCKCESDVHMRCPPDLLGSGHSRGLSMLEPFMHTKQEARLLLAKLRRSVPPSRVVQARHRACELLMPWMASHQHIAWFIPHFFEVNVYPSMLTAMSMGTKAYLPRCQSDGTLRFIPYALGQPLYPHPIHRILEPLPAVETKYDEKITCVVVPSLGLTSQGRRLGYGGGYYDRTFAQYSICPTTVSVLHQELKEVLDWKIEAHDQIIDQVFYV